MTTATSRTREYTIAGKDVGEQAGKIVQFPVFETRDQEVASCGSEEDARELFQSAYDVWLQGRVRAMSGAKNKDGTPKYTLAQIQDWVSNAKYVRRTEGTGAKREAGPIKQLKSERADQIAKARALRATKPKQYEGLKAAEFFSPSMIAEIEAEETAPATV